MEREGIRKWEKQKKRPPCNRKEPRTSGKKRRFQKTKVQKTTGSDGTKRQKERIQLGRFKNERRGVVVNLDVNLQQSTQQQTTWKI